MQLNSNGILTMIAILAAVCWWSVNDKKDKIYCTLIRKDRTKINEWRKKTPSGRVELDGGWFYYTAKTVTYDWLNKGIYLLLPIYIPSALFRWNNKYALDPETFEDGEESPQTRKNLDKEEDLVAWRKSGQQAMNKGKTGMLQAYLPIIMIAGFVILGYLVYTQQQKIDMLGNGMNAITNMLGKLLNK